MEAVSIPEIEMTENYIDKSSIMTMMLMLMMTLPAPRELPLMPRQ